MGKQPESLETLVEQFRDKLGLIPVVAFELEYFLPDVNSTKLHAFNALVLQQAETNGIRLHKIDEETGQDQFEIATFHQPDAIKAAKDIATLRACMEKAAEGLKQQIIFAPKPYINQPGNGLHIHVSLFDNEGHNLLAKPRGEDEETDIMYWSIGGLCETMLDYIDVFVPDQESYKRLTSKKNDNVPTDAQMRAHNQAPTHVSWGGNNRTTAIRIPTSTLYPHYRHIEHRVCGADANPEIALAAILEGILKGISEEIEPPEKIWGNAYDEQYDLTPLFEQRREAD